MLAGKLCHGPRRIARVNRNHGSLPGGPRGESRLATGFAPRPAHAGDDAESLQLAGALSDSAGLLGGPMASAEPVPSTKTLMDALRRATLCRSIASITSIHTVGNVDVLGLRGRTQEWDDLRGVRFTSDLDAGALSGASGWDGKVAWSQDYAGLVTIDGGESGRLQAIDQAYLDNLRYLRPDAGGATVVYAGDAKRRREYLRCSRGDAAARQRARSLDRPRTHLIARVTATVGTVTSTTIYSNYRRVDGALRIRS